MKRLSITESVKLKMAARTAVCRQNLARARGAFSMSFDDIPRTAWTVGGDILAAHGVKATYYLCGGLCGRYFEGREQYRREDAEAIAAAGHEIGSHLFDHVSALRLSDKELDRQIALNDLFFDEVLGRDFQAESFAYPYGDMSVAAKRICARRFKSSRSVIQGLNGGNVDTAQLTIVPLDRNFADLVDWESVLDEAAEKKSWVIALAHGVEERSHDYSCHPYTLDHVLRLARAAGLDILPVAGALTQSLSVPVREAA